MALPSAIDKAAQFGDEVMLEMYIDGREFTVGVLDGHALSVGEIVVPSDIFDYESKYQRGGAQEIFPAVIPTAKAQEIKELGVHVHKVLKLGGYSRVDFRMDEDGNLWCLEANSVPGLTPTSLLPQSAKTAGIEFSELCERICQLGIKRSQCGKNDRSCLSRYAAWTSVPALRASTTAAKRGVHVRFPERSDSHLSDLLGRNTDQWVTLFYEIHLSHIDLPEPQNT